MTKKKTIDADWYLDDSNHVVTREEFFAGLFHWETITVFYIGGGFCPCEVAIQGPDYDAYSVLTEWLMKPECGYSWRDEDEEDPWVDLELFLEELYADEYPASDYVKEEDYD